MMNLFDYLQARLAMSEERGAAAVEYALLVSLIAVAIVGVVLTLGTTLAGIFTNITTSITGG